MFYNNDIQTRLTDLMDIRRGDSVALTGCGGKTSLMYRLSNENRSSSVLIGTTTRIARPDPQHYDFIYDNCGGAQNGITLILGGERNSKLLPAPDETLSRFQRLFDYTFLECDGSRNLPLKGWESFEPVIPDFITITVGVCVIHPIGEILSEENTLRLDRFCEIAGAKEGEMIELKHIAAMISHPDGIFKRSRGKKILLINQIESEDAADGAGKLVEILPCSFLQEVSLIISGSISENRYKILWEKHRSDEY